MQIFFFSFSIFTVWVLVQSVLRAELQQGPQTALDLLASLTKRNRTRKVTAAAEGNPGRSLTCSTWEEGKSKTVTLETWPWRHGQLVREQRPPDALKGRSRQSISPSHFISKEVGTSARRACDERPITV